MSSLRFSLVLFVFLVLASQFFVVAVKADISEDAAASALTDAEEVVASAYQAVLKAEEAGANASSLLVKLNQAGSYLAQGRVAYNMRDFDKAVNFASLSKDGGKQVEHNALELENLALGESLQRQWFTMVGSVVSVALIVLGSFLTWRIFRKRHYQRFSGVKLEVSA